MNWGQVCIPLCYSACLEVSFIKTGGVSEQKECTLCVWEPRHAIWSLTQNMLDFLKEDTLNSLYFFKKCLNCWRNLSYFELPLTKTLLLMQLHSVSMKSTKRSGRYFLCLFSSSITSSLAHDSFNYLASRSNRQRDRVRITLLAAHCSLSHTTWQLTHCSLVSSANQETRRENSYLLLT